MPVGLETREPEQLGNCSLQPTAPTSHLSIPGEDELMKVYFDAENESQVHVIRFSNENN